jgi:hypothetical protein
MKLLFTFTYPRIESFDFFDHSNWKWQSLFQLLSPCLINDRDWMSPLLLLWVVLKFLTTLISKIIDDILIQLRINVDTPTQNYESILTFVSLLKHNIPLLKWFVCHLLTTLRMKSIVYILLFWIHFLKELQIFSSSYY